MNKLEHRTRPISRSDSRPKVAITCLNEDSPRKAHPFFSVRCCCVSVVRRLGGAPFLIPPIFCEDSLEVLYDFADAILIPGGADVSPSHYGGQPHPAMEEHDAERDLVELYLAKRALADKKPLLGICRGMHIINVASGGTLIPNLAEDQLQTHWPRRNEDSEFAWHELAHAIEIANGSMLSGIMGTAQMRINSLHHQCIGSLGQGLRISAFSPDGVAEAIEGITEDAFVLGLQGHPETLCTDILPDWDACFSGLIAAAILHRR